MTMLMNYVHAIFLNDCFFCYSKDSEGKFIMPTDVEIESIRYIIVYDSSTHSLLDSGNVQTPYF